MTYPLWIGGQHVSTSRKEDILVPFDGSVAGEVFLGGPREANAAIEAAQRAFPVMSGMTRHERAAILLAARAGLEQRAEEMSRLLASESGKPIRDARAEVKRGLFTLLFSAEEAHRLAGEEVPIDAHPGGMGRMGMTIRQPLGVVAAITPFNFPLNLPLHKIGPALAAGNTVVHKPASATPLSALLMAEIFAASGLPAGALNVVTGPGGEIGDALTTDSRVAMVTFTGSVAIGQRIRNLAGMKRVTLELGSNSAVIVEPDADLDKAVPRCVAGAYVYAGQVCVSVQRIFVHESIRDEFTGRMIDAAAKVKIGHPLDDSTEMSSLITEGEAKRIETWIGEARGDGAQVAGGERHGATVAPAVVSEAPASSKLMTQEAFGPVVAVNAYQTLDEAIAIVNRSDFGLQAGIYTRNIDNAFRAAKAVHVGGFHINEVPIFRVDQMPYGGVKLSGTGREGPHYAIEEMTELKVITW